MVEIQKVTQREQVYSINRLAREILIPFYRPYLPEEHIRFFLDSFQSVEAIESQMAKNFAYFLLYYHSVEAGYFGVEEQEGELRLSKFYLREAFRRQGIGSRVMPFIDTIAREKGLAKISLFVNKNNRDTIRFYQKHGFESAGLVTHNFESGYAVEDYRMERTVHSLSHRADPPPGILNS